MSLPQIAGHELQDLIGGGSCGAVYRAVAAGGRACAVKVFGAMSINRRGLAATMRALHHMQPHRGILPVHSYSFDQSPYFAAMPLVGVPTREDGSGQNTWQTPTLEGLCGKVPPEQAWRYIYEIADSLAWLHSFGIVHGNLRPANVLIENDPEMATRLTDMGQGWVAGIHHFDLWEHWVHLCPEHLEEPEGLQDGRGMSWDVYSFGVLACRMLTGSLPRGQEAWTEQQAQADRRAASGLPATVDGAYLLSAIRSQPQITWPAATGSKWDLRRRQIIEEALDLDPAKRWRDMREVLREFEILEMDFLLEDAREKIELEKKKQARRVRSLQLLSGAMLAGVSAVTALFAFTWMRAQKAESAITANLSAYEQQTKARDQTIATLTGERDQAIAARQQSDGNLQHSQAAVDQFLTQLLQTPTGNRLEAEFSKEQMADALAYVKGALPALESAPEFAPERARAYGNLGRILLRLHQPQEAAEFLDKARAESAKLLAGNTDSPHAPLYHQWLGRYALLLSQIRSSEGKNEEALALLKDATAHLDKGLQGDQKNRLSRLECARSWLEYGIRCRLAGDLIEASVSLGRVPVVLDAKAAGAELVSEEKFTVARSKFERALADRDSGRIQESLDSLIEAVQEMGQLVAGSSPRNQDQAFALAEAYTELAEIVGKHFNAKDAKDAHHQAVPLLLELNRLHDDWAEVKFLLARNYGAIAGLERDTGGNTEALKKKQDAIELMNEIASDHPDNPRFIYHAAKLKGEYAELLADLGRSKEAMPVAKGSVEVLEKLLALDPAAKIGPERKTWMMQLAHLHGVLGHACEAAGEKDLARASFKTAAAFWEKLAAIDTASDEIQQGLAWIKNRLAKLK